MIVRSYNDELIADLEAILPNLIDKKNQLGFVRNLIAYYYKNHNLSECQIRISQQILQELK